MAHLPQTIEAMFVLPISNADNVMKVTEAHSNFLRRYALPADDGPPIVMYDSSRGEEPFTLYRPYHGRAEP